MAISESRNSLFGVLWICVGVAGLALVDALPATHAIVAAVIIGLSIFSDFVFYYLGRPYMVFLSLVWIAIASLPRFVVNSGFYEFWYLFVAAALTYFGGTLYILINSNQRE